MAGAAHDRNEEAQYRTIAARPPANRRESSSFPPVQTDRENNPREAAGRRRTAKPRPVACQSCRHAKLRCEDSAGGTRPCQRCRELSRPCKVDKNYRRGHKKMTSEAPASHPVEKQHLHPADDQPVGLVTIQDLGQDTRIDFIDDETSAHQLYETTRSCVSDHLPSSGLPDNATPQANGRGISLVPEHEMSQTFDQNDCTIRHARSIGLTTVDPTQIQHFFTVYFKYYHPRLPVLKLHYSADIIYDVSPLLFWTIIMTAARHDRTDFSLSQLLSSHVRSLLWSTVAEPPYILPSLQAMCILCAWPLSASSMTQDITYTLGGVLKTAALQAGLHQPDVFAHFSRSRYNLNPDELREAVSVWCCIYVTIESLGMTAGHSPHIPADRTIEKASTFLNPYDLPPTLHQTVVVQNFCNKVHSAMSDVDRTKTIASHPKRTSILKLLEHYFQELQRQTSSPQSHQAKIELLSAAFQLYGYWLLESTESTFRRTGIIQAYDNTTDLASELEVGDRNDFPIKFSSWSIYMTCFAGAAFISRVVHSSYRPYIDWDKGKRAFNTFVYVLKQCSVEDNDLPGRSSRLVAQIWSIHQSQYKEDDQRPPILKVTSRMFYSIVYDSLFLWREKYAGLPTNGAPSLPPPFIPTSFRSPPLSTTSSQSPTTRAHRNAKQNMTRSSVQIPQIAESPQCLYDFIADIDVVDQTNGPLITASEDFNDLWDIDLCYLGDANINSSLPGL